MKSVYVNLAIHTIRRLRDEIPGGSQLTSPNKNPLTMSHEAVLGGAKATCTSYTVKRSGRLPSVPDKLTGVLVVTNMLILSLSLFFTAVEYRPSNFIAWVLLLFFRVILYYCSTTSTVMLCGSYEHCDLVAILNHGKQ